MSTPAKPLAAIQYPDDDGLPMSDNTLQFEWRQLLTTNLSVLFRGRADVFVGGNLLWYPVEGFDQIRRAPDALVVFGRPTHYRGSCKQWEEDDVPMTVVFEVRSSNDSDQEMEKKFAFYDEYQVEEYILIDPQKQAVWAWRRRGGMLVPVRAGSKVVTSSRLGIRFDWSGGVVEAFYPDGRRFLTYTDLEEERLRANKRADEAELARAEAEARAARLLELVRKVRRAQAPRN